MPRMNHTFYIAMGYAFGTSTMNCTMSSSPCHFNCGTTSWGAHHVHHRMQRSCVHGWKVVCWAGQKCKDLKRRMNGYVGIHQIRLRMVSKKGHFHRQSVGESQKKAAKWSAADSHHPSQPRHARRDFCPNMSLRILQRGWEADPLTERRWPDVFCDTCVLFYSEGVPFRIHSLHWEPY